MNGKALLMLVALLGAAFGLIGGAVTVTLNVKDSIHEQIVREIAPLREDIREMKALILKSW